MIIEGLVKKLKHNISTEIILPQKYHHLVNSTKISQYLFSSLKSEKIRSLKSGEIIIAGKNFGIGTYSDKTSQALFNAKPGCVIASSFNREIFRNLINFGLCAIECSEVFDIIKTGDRININLESGIISTPKKNVNFQPFPTHIVDLFKSGGLISYSKSLIAY